MATFEELLASRRDWIEQVLKPWCTQASLEDLEHAEADWEDMAGCVDPASTLWVWAWSRFREMIHKELNNIDETSEVEITLQDGTKLVGFPDANQGQLVLMSISAAVSRKIVKNGPYSIDHISSVTKRLPK